MKAVVERILKNNLQELKGLSVEGEIPITEEFLNELMLLLMESNESSQPMAAHTTSSSGEKIDVMQIIKSLDKKELRVELKEKLAILKISAKKF